MVSSRHVARLLRAQLPAAAFQRLRHAGMVAEQQGCAVCLVGGSVRNLLLGVETLDLDLVVEGDGIAFARALAEVYDARLRLHERFGTAVLTFSDGTTLDVATARTEQYAYPAALPTVAWSTLHRDLSRRDFTINTLAVRLNPGRFGRLLDPYGGRRDLTAGVIRVLHPRSFLDDPTRLFRAVRFECRFAFRMSAETARLAEADAVDEALRRLSAHRVLNEFRLLPAEPSARCAVRRLGRLDVLWCFHPTLTWSRRLDGRLEEVAAALDRYRTVCPNHQLEPWLVVAATLLNELPDDAVRDVLNRFPFTEVERAALTAARFGVDALFEQIGRRHVRPSEIIRRLSGIPDETLVYLWATSRSGLVKRHIMVYLARDRRAAPPLTGNDVQTMGITPGPIVGAILAQVTDAWVDGAIRTTEEARAMVKQLRSLESGVEQACGLRERALDRRDRRGQAAQSRPRGGSKRADPTRGDRSGR